MATTYSGTCTVEDALEQIFILNVYNNMVQFPVNKSLFCFFGMSLHYQYQFKFSNTEKSSTRMAVQFLGKMTSWFVVLLTSVLLT